MRHKRKAFHPCLVLHSTHIFLLCGIQGTYETNWGQGMHEIGTTSSHWLDLRHRVLISFFLCPCMSVWVIVWWRRKRRMRWIEWANASKCIRAFEYVVLSAEGQKLWLQDGSGGGHVCCLRLAWSTGRKWAGSTISSESSPSHFPPRDLDASACLLFHPLTMRQTVPNHAYRTLTVYSRLHLSAKNRIRHLLKIIHDRLG